MERHIWKNAKNAKWVIASLLGGTLFAQYLIYRPGLLHLEVFGVDGNGGRMLPLLNATYYPNDLTENAIQIIGEMVIFTTFIHSHVGMILKIVRPVTKAMIML